MKLQWWCEVLQVTVVKSVVTLPSFVHKYQCFRRMWYIKRGEGTGSQWQTMTAVYS
jgi:hypothetical protein